MKTAGKKIKYVLLCLALTLLAGAIIIFPERYIACCFQGFALWAECVLPSLFPFMVITLILIKTGIAEKAALPLRKVTGIFSLPPAAAVCFVMSICSGYPAGSKCVYEFYENGCICARDARKLSALCSTSGPLFIIGSVGVKMFADKSVGWKIMLAHIISVLVIALAVALFSKNDKGVEIKRAPVGGNVLYDSFYGAVTSVAVAGGFIAFFCVAAQVMCDFEILKPLELLFTPFFGDSANALCRGLIEATSGCRAIAEVNGKFALPLAGFTITFGGLSIIFQQLSYLLKAKVSALYFTAIKFVQGVVCFLILLIFI